jgi:hypothetical protein
MRAKKPLEPHDFPVESTEKATTKSNGERIAEADNEPMAEEISDRLNSDHTREKEDRWA